MKWVGKGLYYVVQVFIGEYIQRVDKKGCMLVFVEFCCVFVDGDLDCVEGENFCIVLVYGCYLKQNIQVYMINEYQWLVDEIYVMLCEKVCD